jgi:hypothetical protein
VYLSVNVGVGVPQQSAYDIGFQIVARRSSAVREIALFKHALYSELLEKFEVFLQRVKVYKGLEIVSEVYGVIPYVKSACVAFPIVQCAYENTFFGVRDICKLFKGAVEPTGYRA